MFSVQLCMFRLILTVFTSLYIMAALRKIRIPLRIECACLMLFWTLGRANDNRRSSVIAPTKSFVASNCSKCCLLQSKLNDFKSKITNLALHLQSVLGEHSSTNGISTYLDIFWVSLHISTHLLSHWRIDLTFYIHQIWIILVNNWQPRSVSPLRGTIHIKMVDNRRDFQEGTVKTAELNGNA